MYAWDNLRAVLVAFVVTHFVYGVEHFLHRWRLDDATILVVARLLKEDCERKTE